MSTVEVVMVAYNGREWLPAGAGTLPVASGRDWHLVLVDNAGDNGIERLPLGEWPVEVLATPYAMGFAEANNFALRSVEIEGEAVCFLNQDTRSEAGWLDACLDVLRERPDVGAVSPLLRTYDGGGWDPNFLACARVSPAFREFERTGEQGEAFLEVPEVTAAAMVVRTEALRLAGPFDPIFGSYYEDYDLCRRIREAGYGIGICTRGTVCHFSGSATTNRAAERRRTRLVLRNRAIHRIRSEGRSRWATMLRTLSSGFVYNLGRGLVGTKSSQPPMVQIAAHLDLLKLVPRLVSRKRDAAAWRRYLDGLGWPATAADEAV